LADIGVGSATACTNEVATSMITSATSSSTDAERIHVDHL
jgi:hypothetical protein